MGRPSWATANRNIGNVRGWESREGYERTQKKKEDGEVEEVEEREKGKMVQLKFL